jgi:hypothetical protein
LLFFFTYAHFYTPLLKPRSIPYQIKKPSTKDGRRQKEKKAPTTATHSINTSQRHLDLRITRDEGGTLQLQAPPSAQAAIPGFYMLFLLNDEGVPSEAAWVQFGPPAER